MSAYVERVARFLLSLLVSGLLLAMLTVAAHRPAHGPTPPSVWGPPLVVGAQTLFVTAPVFAKGLLLALPFALLIGVPAGLRRRSRLDRAGQTVAVLLAGLTCPLLGLGVAHALQVALKGPWSETASWIVLAAGMVPWLALAVRNGLAQSAPEPARKLLGVLGAVLQQTGNLTVVCLVAEATFGQGAGVYTALLYSLMGANVAVFTGILATLIPPVLILHFAGDLAAAAAVGSEPPTQSRTSWWWVGAGGLLTLVMVALAFATFRAPMGHPIMARAGATYWLGTDLQGRDLMALAAFAARHSLLRTAGIVAVALLAGAGLGALGQVTGRVGAAYFSPHVTSPALLGPFLAGLWASVLFGMNTWAWVIALGAASSPAIAHAVRGYLTAPDSDARRGALFQVAGAAAVVAAQVLVADTALGFVRARDGSLGVWALDVMSSWTNYRILLPAAAVAAGIAGLFLLGWGLRGVQEEPPGRLHLVGGKNAP